MTARNANRRVAIAEADQEYLGAPVMDRIIGNQAANPGHGLLSNSRGAHAS